MTMLLRSMLLLSPLCLWLAVSCRSRAGSLRSRISGKYGDPAGVEELSAVVAIYSRVCGPTHTQTQLAEQELTEAKSFLQRARRQVAICKVATSSRGRCCQHACCTSLSL